MFLVPGLRNLQALGPGQNCVTVILTAWEELLQGFRNKPGHPLWNPHAGAGNGQLEGHLCVPQFKERGPESCPLGPTLPPSFCFLIYKLRILEKVLSQGRSWEWVSGPDSNSHLSQAPSTVICFP